MAKHEKKMSFGGTVRELRMGKRITLRKFAAAVGISPTYLSKIERGEFPPPGEDKIKAIARELDQDSDELLALAGKVASDLPEVIQRHPREMASFLRTARGLSSDEIEDLTRQAAERRRRKSK